MGTNKLSSLRVLLDFDGYKQIVNSESFVGFRWV